MEIQLGDGYKLRRWSQDDIPSLVKYADNRSIWLNLTDTFPHPYTEDDARDWVGIQEKQEPQNSFVIAYENELIGATGFRLGSDAHFRSAEVGYWLAEPFWGRGIATLALNALVEYVLANHDLVRLYAHGFDWNPASARVLEKAGFTFEARLRKNVTKDGKTIDELVYALIRD